MSAMTTSRNSTDFSLINARLCSAFIRLIIDKICDTPSWALTDVRGHDFNIAAALPGDLRVVKTSLPESLCGPSQQNKAPTSFSFATATSRLNTYQPAATIKSGDVDGH